MGVCVCVFAVHLQAVVFVCVETISVTALAGWFSGVGGLLSETISDGCAV